MTKHSAHGRRLARAGAAAVLVASVVGLQVPAGAETDPIGDLTNGLKDSVAKATGSGSGSGTSSTPSAPSSSTTSSSSGLTTSSDSDSPGYETPDPKAPDHGSSYVADAQVGGQDVAGVGRSNATVNPDGSTSSGTTLLALGGTALPLGHSEASSSGPSHQESNTLAPLTGPLCSGSGGAVCLDVLYADSSASQQGDTSSASSDGGIAHACLGGSDPSGETCDGQGQLAVGTSYARAQRSGGTTTAQSGTQLLGICLGDFSGSCGVGAETATSNGRSSSDGYAQRGSTLLGLSVAGNDVIPAQSDPLGLSLAPECDPTVACVFANQGESYIGDGLAGHAQKALAVRLLTDLVTLGVGQSETLVSASGSAVVSPPSGNGGHGGNGGPDGQAAPAPGAGVLPNTGGPWSGALGLGLLLVGLGAGAVAWERRGELVRG